MVFIQLKTYYTIQEQRHTSPEENHSKQGLWIHLLSRVVKRPTTTYTLCDLGQALNLSGPEFPLL